MSPPKCARVWGKGRKAGIKRAIWLGHPSRGASVTLTAPPEGCLPFHISPRSPELGLCSLLSLETVTRPSEAAVGPRRRCAQSQVQISPPGTPGWGGAVEPCCHQAGRPWPAPALCIKLSPRLSPGTRLEIKRGHFRKDVISTRLQDRAGDRPQSSWPPPCARRTLLSDILSIP